jgi:hypothetical protein
MSDFVIAMCPIVFLWSVPLLPMICVGIATSVESVVAKLRWS